MKVLDLRKAGIEPKVDENVSIITESMIYECVAIDVEDSISCEGCVLRSFTFCDRILCSRGKRKDEKNIVLKCISRKRMEVENA